MNRAGGFQHRGKQTERDKVGQDGEGGRSSRKGILHVPDLAHEFLQKQIRKT